MTSRNIFVSYKATKVKCHVFSDIKYLEILSTCELSQNLQDQFKCVDLDA